MDENYICFEVNDKKFFVEEFIAKVLSN